MSLTAHARLVFAVFAFATWLSEGGLAADFDVPTLNAEKVFPGTTLFSVTADFRGQKIVETDMEGNTRWSYAIPNSLRGDKGFLLDVNLLDNGHILFTLHGAGIFEITREGDVVWSHGDPAASHDADRLANGNTLYNRGWVAKGEAVALEVTPEGKTVWSWDGLAAFDRPQFAEIDEEGWMHVNSVSRLPNGNTLISIRNFNTVVEVSEDGDVVWSITFGAPGGKGFPATKGRIKGARNHEPELLENGNLLVALRNPHRFVELDRERKSIVWQWEHPDGHEALQTNREANRLPNGNTLVSSQDRLYEVTRDGEIVWQLNAPRQGDNRRKFHKGDPHRPRRQDVRRLTKTWEALLVANPVHSSGRRRRIGVVAEADLRQQP